MTLGGEPPSQGSHLVFACFQGDLLSQHHIADWQINNRRETQALPETTSFVELAYINRGASIDPVLISGVPSDNIEVTLACELLSLRLRQPFSQHA